MPYDDPIDNTACNSAKTDKQMALPTKTSEEILKASAWLNKSDINGAVIGDGNAIVLVIHAGTNDDRLATGQNVKGIANAYLNKFGKEVHVILLTPAAGNGASKLVRTRIKAACDDIGKAAKALQEQEDGVNVSVLHMSEITIDEQNDIDAIYGEDKNKYHPNIKGLKNAVDAIVSTVRKSEDKRDKRLMLLFVGDSVASQLVQHTRTRVDQFDVIDGQKKTLTTPTTARPNQKRPREDDTEKDTDKNERETKSFKYNDKDRFAVCIRGESATNILKKKIKNVSKLDLKDIELVYICRLNNPKASDMYIIDNGTFYYRSYKAFIQGKSDAQDYFVTLLTLAKSAPPV